jgi:S-DNA-T family DNA segregation ATPase FtsK/SpoIIIE
LFSLFGYAGFFVPFFLFAAAWFALNQRAHTLWPVKVTLMAAVHHPVHPDPHALARHLARRHGRVRPRGPAACSAGRLLHTHLFHPSSTTAPGSSFFPYGFCLLGALADDPKATLASWIAEMRDAFGAWNAERKAAALKAAEEQRRRDAAAAELRRKQAEVVGAVMPVPQPKETAQPATKTAPVVVDIPHEGPADDEDVGPDLVEPDKVTISPPTPRRSRRPRSRSPSSKKTRRTKEVAEAKPPRKAPQPLGPNAGKVLVVQPDKIEKARASQVIKKRGDYVFPEIKMLNEPAAGSKAAPEDFRKRAADLIETLKQFKVDCIPVDPANGVDVGIQQGPSITRYEIKPAPGVRVEKISNLSNNIAMNLEAEAVRILAPVPGKGTVGIEIPNKSRKDVLLREIIESKASAETQMELPFVLGVDSVTNKPIIQDLAKMPHALIAGATGQGKSVCINAVIVSLLYRCTPQDLRFIMVDPKVVELQIYNNLPHLLIPVETDPKRVPAALKWLIAEMSLRYKIFAKCGVKNITGFNAKIAKEAGAPKQEELPLSAEEQAAAAAAAEEVIDDGVRVPAEKP